MRILITHSYFIRLDLKQLSSETPYPPLATLYVASFLRANGHEIKIADLQFAHSPNAIDPFLTEFKPDVLVIYDDGFNYLTKMCLTNMREAAFAMQKLAREKNIPVIVSSSDATDHILEYCNQGADYVIIGEAEITLKELVEKLDSKNPSKEINGLAFVENGKVIKTAPRQVSRDLDLFPKPAWDLIDIEPYKKIWINRHGYFSLNFVTTRGCPYKCNWCAKPIYGNRYNSHSPQYVVEMIKEAYSRFKFDHIWFADDIFGLKPGWLNEFASLIKKEGIKIRYKIQSRADLLLEEENIKHLAQSGCQTVWLGAESGSQKILDAMDKGIKVDEIRRAVHLLKQHKIQAGLFLQFGYPGENADDLKRTVDMVKELVPDDIGISVSYPLPGTGFYERVKEQLPNKSNWTDSDDLQLMFKNTYSADFYKHLHRYVHNTYRAQQAINLLRKGQFGNYRRIALWPYYKLKSYREKYYLNKLEPVAASFL
ncbi:MAG: B12-binding domain-containing radical SAM protein [Bacteroidetes bacterium]|nr:B12-binding domain-containing radical SAM protein [Bacteroidota bacterium]